MRFVRFEIKNFKGIKSAVLDLSKMPSANVFTLVGLNESGKTTVLEAINNFSPEPEGVAAVYRDVMDTVQLQDIVPKTRKANFSGEIITRAILEPDEDAKLKIVSFCRTTLRCEIDISKLSQITIERKHKYADSNHVDSSNYWSIDVWFKKFGDKDFVPVEETPEWEKLVRFIGKEIIPRICYFPTFLFNFPERIYLSNPPPGIDVNVNDYYLKVVQDVLDSLEENLSIDKHVVERIERTRTADAPWNLIEFFQSDEKQQVDHVMLKIGARITEVVFGRWNDIFGVKIQNKSIDVEWQVEQGEQQEPSLYLKFWVRDGQARFAITERSLGFRWFFCFLLFTQFRIARKNSSTLFLFDEPASNLHSRAQEQLLRSFSTISVGNNMTLYSTHSHYMIEPRWLEGAFIVFNDAVDYEGAPGAEVGNKPTETNIHVRTYRDFVGQNPGRTTYYQPILDKLNYAPSKLELVPRSVFVEGKNDFYMLSYFKEVVLESTYDFRFVPSVGADGLGPLISLYLGWGTKFVVLLDGDEAGIAARNRYRRDWALPDDVVLTISDLVPRLGKHPLEFALSKGARAVITRETGSVKLKKKEIARYFQEKFARAEKVSFDQETLHAMTEIIAKCGARFK
jgi:hypothetical protein